MRELHSYMGGFCAYCGSDLGYIEVDGGRTRRYCNDKCRKAASRKRVERNKAMSKNGAAFVGLWEENGIRGAVREQLEDILASFGVDACRAATNAVITAKNEVEGRYMSRDFYAGMQLQLKDTETLLTLRTNELLALRDELNALKQQEKEV